MNNKKTSPLLRINIGIVIGLFFSSFAFILLSEIEINKPINYIGENVKCTNGRDLIIGEVVYQETYTGNILGLVVSGTQKSPNTYSDPRGFVVEEILINTGEHVIGSNLCIRQGTGKYQDMIKNAHNMDY